ncbi:hypothetical protein DPMN_024196 [Dreissena polymorpha]|uniref:Polycystin domain-containing protein n=1 Tax=Dreissena polymorpha TaxID=45954 RepID=A0A9D4RAL2_DREPO|nr:hypothetical protein DPMN_024196 [Dreissena polymorpha]
MPKPIYREKETTDYCKGWAHFPCPVAEKSISLTSSAWLYNFLDEVWGFSTYALYNTYGGGGYFMKLDVNSDVSQKIFVELNENSWFDNQTRAVILKFFLNNANANLFVYAKFVDEFPEIAGFLPYSTISVFRLYLHYGQEGNFIMFFELVFLLITLFATINIAYQIHRPQDLFQVSLEYSGHFGTQNELYTCRLLCLCLN